MTAEAFLTGQLSTVAGAGFEVHLLCGERGDLADLAAAENARLHVVPLSRQPSLRADLLAALRIARLLLVLRPRIVVMGTPKMALLGLAAAWLVRIPRRIYVLHGLRLEGGQRASRCFLWILEHLTCRLATEVVAVSPSLSEKAVRIRVLRRDRVTVLGHGSANGIDTARFRPASQQQQQEARHQLGVAGSGPVVCFVGRLTVDKGLVEMVNMWPLVRACHPDAQLLVVGGDETSDDDGRAALSALRRLQGVTLCGPRPDVEQVYRASDIALLLTRREGMPTVPLEAAACGLPVVASLATGTVDAVESGRTGILVGQGDHEAAARAVVSLLSDPDLSALYGSRGREMVLSRFREEDVWAAWTQHLTGARARCRRD